MKNSVLHKAATRGHANHGWLDAHHTFSFANYHDPDRMHFGVLRVLNDDRIDGGRGFGSHPHDNMEIITIPLEGDLKHEDNMGNSEVIRNGEIQVMSAGTGVFHSEVNANPGTPVKLLQIWLFPNKRNVTPRYDQQRIDNNKVQNQLKQILSPNPEDDGVWIHQDAWFNIGTFDEGAAVTYDVKKEGNGVYAFIIKGSFEINGTTVEQRDGFGVWNTNALEIKALSADAELLLMDVPMALN